MRAESQTSASVAPSALGRWGSFMLSALAVVAIEAALYPFDSRQHAALFCAAAGVAVAAAAAAAEFLRRRFPAVGSTRQSLCEHFAAVIGVALVGEIALRTWLHGLPLLDIVLFVFLRDAVIALAVLSHHAAPRRSAALLATFLAVAASATATDVRIQGIVVLFAGLGACWLMGEHWDSLRGHLPRVSGKQPPRSWFAGAPLAVVVVPLILPAVGLATWALDGFMPASGGRQWSSPSARSGVGDGDMLVRGLDDIRSFGPIEDAPFVNAEEATLYDMFDDTYNEPVKRSQQRAISLPTETFRRPEDPTLAKSNRAGREFSTVRRPGKPSSRRIADLDTPALFYVQGRVPLHLRLETFAGYDGVAWIPEEAPDPIQSLAIDMVHGRPWLRPGLGTYHDFYAPPETHAIKVARLRSDRVPSPNQLVGVHIDKVDKADFYHWAQPGIVRIDDASIPEQTVVHLQSRVVDPRRFAQAGSCYVGGPDGYRHYGDDPQSVRVRSLAESWVAGLPHGLPQIERVVERLRTDYALDPAARATAEGGHSVAEFLLETRRGPDYLFASAAVQALRSLGYSARLVSGFHARPSRYDARSGHTPVLAEDVHFWAEVGIGPGHWMSLEPSPGYELLGTPLSLPERLLAAAVAAVRAIYRHPVASLAVVAAAALLWWRRVVVADALDGLLVRLRRGGDDRAALLAAVALLDRRCRRAGLPRPPHTTPPRWLAELSERMTAIRGVATPCDEQGRAFVRLADAALYAPAFRCAQAEDRRRSAEAIWSLENLAALSAARRARPSTSPGDAQ
jgi:transglutaminase-like putative cysteine protease